MIQIIGMMMVQTSHQRERKNVRGKKSTEEETFLSVSYETGVDFSKAGGVYA